MARWRIEWTRRVQPVTAQKRLALVRLDRATGPRLVVSVPWGRRRIFNASDAATSVASDEGRR